MINKKRERDILTFLNNNKDKQKHKQTSTLKNLTQITTKKFKATSTSTFKQSNEYKTWVKHKKTSTDLRANLFKLIKLRIIQIHDIRMRDEIINNANKIKKSEILAQVLWYVNNLF